MKSLTFNIPPNPVEAHKVMSGAVWQHVKAHAMAGNRIAIRICDQDKSREAEEKYHAMIGEISAQIGGDLENEEDAKRILISAFRIDTIKELADEWAKFGDLRMGRGLRGEVVLMGVQSRHFSGKLSRAFIEWLYAFGAESGVVFTEKTIDPQTGEIVTARRQKEAA
jgi:NinB protein